jgi:hypothetical protein
MALGDHGTARSKRPRYPALLLLLVAALAGCGGALQEDDGAAASSTDPLWFDLAGIEVGDRGFCEPAPSYRSLLESSTGELYGAVVSRVLSIDTDEITYRITGNDADRSTRLLLYALDSPDRSLVDADAVAVTDRIGEGEVVADETVAYWRPGGEAQVLSRLADSIADPAAVGAWYVCGRLEDEPAGSGMEIDVTVRFDAVIAPPGK